MSGTGASGGGGGFEAFRMDAATLGSMASTSAAAPAPAAGGGQAGAEGAGKPMYPTLESVLADEKKFNEVMDACEKTMAKLEETGAKGANEKEKYAARKALRAYEHTLELVRMGAELKASIVKEVVKRREAATKEKRAAKGAGKGKK